MTHTKSAKTASTIVLAILMSFGAARADTPLPDPGLKPGMKPPGTLTPPNRVELMQAWSVVMDYPKLVGTSPNMKHQVWINGEGVTFMGYDTDSIGLNPTSWISLNTWMNQKGGDRLPQGSYRVKLRFITNPKGDPCTVTMHNSRDNIGIPDAAVLASVVVPPGPNYTAVQEISFDNVPVRDTTGNILVSFKVSTGVGFVGATLEKVGMPAPQTGG